MTLPGPPRECQMLLWESQAMGLGSWSRAGNRSSLHKLQTHLPEPTCLHRFPLVTCPSCLELNTFFFPPLQGSQVFLFLPWEKQVAILGACGIQAHDSLSTPCMKDEIHNLCARGTASCRSTHSARMVGWLRPTRDLTLGHGMACAPQAQVPELPSLF